MSIKLWDRFNRILAKFALKTQPTTRITGKCFQHSPACSHESLPHILPHYVNIILSIQITPYPPPTYAEVTFTVIHSSKLCHILIGLFLNSRRQASYVANLTFDAYRRLHGDIFFTPISHPLHPFGGSYLTLWQASGL